MLNKNIQGVSQSWKIVYKIDHKQFINRSLLLIANNAGLNVDVNKS